MALDDFKDVIHRCFRCGYCKFTSNYTDFNCPPYNKFRLETFSPGGRMWLIRAMMLKDIEPSQHLADILYSCTMCANCVEECRFKFHDDIVDIIMEGKASLVESGMVPPTARDFFKNIYLSGNPWKEPQQKRGDWARHYGIPVYKPGDEYLYYVGCIGSYDQRVQKMAGAFGQLLLRAGLSFGILGEDEYCDGNEVLMMGEQGLFEYLAQKNIELFKERRVNKIVTLSPHAYNVMRNKYPRLGGDFEVVHYTELLKELISSGRLKVPGGRKIKVTYHDPCFLGRWNSIYDEPREVLESVDGVELVEMRRNRENAFCCGGGGGNFYTDIIGGGESSPSRIRVREAADTGADIIAVACPTCMTMIEDGLKGEDLDEKIMCNDISEIVLDAITSAEEG